MSEGEVGVQASTGGRQLTLDPIRVIPVTVDVREVESTIPCGFRMGWVDGEADGKEFDIAAGAGCGSRWLTIKYGDKYFCMDIEDFLQSFIGAVEDD